MSAATAVEAGVDEGDLVTVSTAAGSLALTVALTEMPDRVVWVPTAQVGLPVRSTLRATAGDVVTLSPGGAA